MSQPEPCLGWLFSCLQKVHNIEGPFPDFEGRIEVRVVNRTSPAHSRNRIWSPAQEAAVISGFCGLYTPAAAGAHRPQPALGAGPDDPHRSLPLERKIAGYSGTDIMMIAPPVSVLAQAAHVIIGAVSCAAVPRFVQWDTIFLEEILP